MALHIYIYIFRIANENGLELIYSKEFHELFEEEIDNNEKSVNLLYHMRVLDQNGTISSDEWEASGLYSAFAFRKTR